MGSCGVEVPEKEILWKQSPREARVQKGRRVETGVPRRTLTGVSSPGTPYPRRSKSPHRPTPACGKS